MPRQHSTVLPGSLVHEQGGARPELWGERLGREREREREREGRREGDGREGGGRREIAVEAISLGMIHVMMK